MVAQIPGLQPPGLQPRFYIPHNLNPKPYPSLLNKQLHTPPLLMNLQVVFLWQGRRLRALRVEEANG